MCLGLSLALWLMALLATAAANQAAPSVERAWQPPGDLNSPVSQTTTDKSSLAFSYSGQFGGPVDRGAEMDVPVAIGVSPSGYVYIGEDGADRIQKYSSNGVLIAQWGGAGQLSDPAGIAFDASGNVYVTDWANDRIQKFDRDGNLIIQWGSSGDGEFDTIAGIAVDSAGYVYVADTNANRIQKFDGEGNFAGQWGVYGSAAGELFMPYGLAIDGEDNIYVVDSGNERVQVFNTDGVYLRQWGGGGTGNSQFDDPFGIAVSSDGAVYVADYLNNRIQVFTVEGDYLRQWGASGAGPGALSFPEAVAVGPDGNVYVLDERNRVQKFDERGKLLDQWSDGRRGRLANSTFGMALDADGNLYLSDDSYDRIQVFDGAGDFLREVGEPGSGTGRLDGAQALAAGPGGLIYSFDMRLNRIIAYTRDDGHFSAWSGRQLDDPFGIEVDEDGNVYVADAGNDSIRVFDGSGNLLRTWGGSDGGEVRFDHPSDIAIHAGRAYVVDTDNHRIQMFTTRGVYLGQWGGYGSGDGRLSEPMGIGVDQDGNVYVVDTGNHRIQVFTPEGGYLTQFGSQGDGPGQFNYPTRIEIGRDNTIYVLDAVNYRVQVFAVKKTTPPVTERSRGLGNMVGGPGMTPANDVEIEEVLRKEP